MLEEFFKTNDDDDLDWLAPVLFRRAAIAYEQAGFTREAADCWAAAHEPGHASELYLHEGDYERAAPLLLAAGHYEEALRMYELWEQALRHPDDEEPFTIEKVKVPLGRAACLFLLKRFASDTSEARKLYRVARQLIEEFDVAGQGRETDDRRYLHLAAKLWEALAEYGVIVGRSDLVQLGYEQALARYGASFNDERGRALRAYIEAVASNRLLAAELETRLAEWDRNYFNDRGTRQGSY
jgi:tetratricopeptide (TPR) repeat protein